MRRNLTAVFLLSAIVGLRGTVSADDAPAAVVPKSAPVSLGDGDYRLIADRTDKISLTYTSKTTSRQWQIKPSPLERETPKLLWPDDAAPHVIRQVVLVRRKSESLLAVVKTVHEHQVFFWIFELPNIVECDASVKELRPFAVLLSVGRSGERILAVSGDINPPAFTVVTGIISETNPGEIEAGSITFEWCGFVEYALTGEIKPSYPKKPPE